MILKDKLVFYYVLMRSEVCDYGLMRTLLLQGFISAGESEINDKIKTQ